MSVKIKLGALPDFKLPVTFMQPNGVEGKIVFTVKHLPYNELNKIVSDDGVSDQDFVKKVAAGWDLEEEFNGENIDLLANLFPGAILGLVASYMSALAGQRVKS